MCAPCVFVSGFFLFYFVQVSCAFSFKPRPPELSWRWSQLPAIISLVLIISTVFSDGVVCALDHSLNDLNVGNLFTSSFFWV